jgi:hypothetical protein
MTLTEIVQALGSGTGITAFSFFILWLTGLIHTKAAMDDKNKQLEKKDEEIVEYKEALRLERQRGDSVVLTGQIVRDVLQTLHKEIQLCGGSGEGQRVNR